MADTVDEAPPDMAEPLTVIEEDVIYEEQLDEQPSEQPQATDMRLSKEPLPAVEPPCLSYISLFRYSTPKERRTIALGCFGAVVTGAMTPIYALMFGRLLNAFFVLDLEGEVQRAVLAIVGVAIAAFVGGTLQNSCLVWSGTQLANRVRQLYLASLLSQDMPFFDTAAAGAAGLLHALRDEAGQYQEAVSEKLGAFLQGVACFVAGMIVAFVRGWDLSLVVLAAIPALVLVGAICAVFTTKLQTRASRAYGRAGAIAQEAVGNIRTVAAFGQEEGSLRGYAAALAEPTRVGEWQGVLAGFTLGSTHLVFYCAYALSLWYGARRVADGGLDGGRVMSVLMSCVLSGFYLGQAMPHLAVFQRGKLAAASLFSVIERQPETGGMEDPALALALYNPSPVATADAASAQFSITPIEEEGAPEGSGSGTGTGLLIGAVEVSTANAGKSAQGSVAWPSTGVQGSAGQLQAGGPLGSQSLVLSGSQALVPAGSQSFHPPASQLMLPVGSQALVPVGGWRGELELRDVHFSYPARPQHPVFTGINMVFPAGRSTALVGESGCGKSTIIQLLLRLYNPTAGAVTLDSHDVRTLPLHWLRAQIGYVSQNPVLFASTVFDNIALATGANFEQVVQAAMAANAHAFIEALPNGYDTVVSERGANLSGGQKQRIAVARAILLNPQILLLDEATSALDPSCEREVQAALEALAPGRTCVTVAHRLSTVAAADAILVLRRGQVVESGTHQELVAAGGYYASLAARQAAHAEDSGTVGGTDGGAGHDGSGQGMVVDAMVTIGSCRASGASKGGAQEATGGAVSAFQRLRESILHRGSVRISVIPQRLKDKIKAQKDAEEGAAVAAAAQPSPFSRLAELNRPELWHGVVGLACACVAGLQMPIFALALSEVFSSYWDPFPHNIRVAGTTWALVFICIGCGAFLLETLQGWCFGVMGQRLASRVRILLLQSLLHQDVQFFDRPENATGALMSTLAHDASAVRGMVGDRLGHLATVFACVIGSYALAFSRSWSVTLVVTAALPVLVLSHALLARINFGHHRSGHAAHVEADCVAAEAVGAIKTVAAFNMQPSYVALYSLHLERTAHPRTALASGLGLGFSQFVCMAISALAFWYGGTQVLRGAIDFRQLLTAFFAVFYAAFGVGQAAGAFPDIARAADAVRSVFRVLDHCPPSAQGAVDAVTSSAVAAAVAARDIGADLELEGEVELRKVAFAYPSRPGRLVLKDFCLKVPCGTSCALVGESGHGKSTILALLERFYEPVDGQVFIDGINIKSLNLRCLRRQLALVGQEPVIFSASIYDNLVLSSGATPEQVVEAAEAAQALDFIQDLPNGFATRLGDAGTQLSGGQLQRLAVARAMLRQPRVLLLDEPTSALDAETEQAVMASLDAAMAGRTTLVVAHRLATVQRCTSIAAVYRGRVLEQGSHEELVALSGYYRHMWEASQRS